MPKSTIIASSIADNAITSNQIADNAITSNQLETFNPGKRNIIINGAMQVFQRGTSLAQAGGATTYSHSADRFRYERGTDQWAGTMSQSTDTPATEQFQYSLKTLTTTVETAVDSDDYLQHTYYVEVNQGAKIGFGKSSCQVSTLSFWVKSSLAGLYGIGISNHDGTQTLPLEYTINSANTWEKKVLTVPARTSGTWETSDNAKLLGIRFTMGKTGSAYASGTAGSWSDDSGYAKLNSNNQSSFADWYRTANSEFYLTGVQYEVGSAATPFEYRTKAQEELDCYRYFYTEEGVMSVYSTYYSSGKGIGNYRWKVPMRTAPTITITLQSGGMTANGSTVQGFYAYHGTATSADYLQFKADAEL